MLWKQKQTCDCCSVLQDTIEFSDGRNDIVAFSCQNSNKFENYHMQLKILFGICWRCQAVQNTYKFYVSLTNYIEIVPGIHLVRTQLETKILTKVVTSCNLWPTTSDPPTNTSTATFMVQVSQLSNFLWWYSYSLSSTCYTTFIDWLWPYFNVTAMSIGFNWKFYFFLWLS